MYCLVFTQRRQKSHAIACLLHTVLEKHQFSSVSGCNLMWCSQRLGSGLIHTAPQFGSVGQTIWICKVWLDSKTAFQLSVFSLGSALFSHLLIGCTAPSIHQYAKTLRVTRNLYVIACPLISIFRLPLKFINCFMAWMTWQLFHVSDRPPCPLSTYTAVLLPTNFMT